MMHESRSISRRGAIQLGLATGASAFAGRFSFAAPAATSSRLVVIIMRGALDGLSAAPPYGDPDYVRLPVSWRSPHPVPRIPRYRWMASSGSIPVWNSCTNPMAPNS